MQPLFQRLDHTLVVEQNLEVVRQLMQEGYRALDLVEYQGSRIVVNAARIAFVRGETNLGPVIPGAGLAPVR